MCARRVVITGVSGLLGQLLFKYLSTQNRPQFDVYGLDTTRDQSPRYQQENPVETRSIIGAPKDRFVRSDVTDRQALHQILADLRIEIIIHLAALLETTADTEKLLRVNVDGSRNVFEVRELNAQDATNHTRFIDLKNSSSLHVSFCLEETNDNDLLMKT